MISTRRTRNPPCRDVLKCVEQLESLHPATRQHTGSPVAQTSKAVREGFREEGDHMCVRFERWGERHVGREVVTDVPFTRTQRKAGWRTVHESTGMDLGGQTPSGQGRVTHGRFLSKAVTG